MNRLCDICGFKPANDIPFIAHNDTPEFLCDSCSSELGAVLAEDEESQIGWMEYFWQEDRKLDRQLRERPHDVIIPCDPC